MRNHPNRAGRLGLPPPLWIAAAAQIAAAAAICAAALGAAGCERRSEALRGGQPASPRRGGTVVIGWTAEPSGVNELVGTSTQVTTEMLRKLFLHLVEEQPDFERHPPTFTPLLARSYDWSPDHKLLTFHLRDDVTWSDGVPVTADDVRWTWQAQKDPRVAWNYSYMKARIADAEVVDPHTVRFHFSHAYATQMLDVNEGVILPKHAWEKLPFDQWKRGADWFKQHMVVDGPFTIESWRPQQEVVLLRNPRYFDQPRPYLERVVFRIVPSQANLVAQFLDGELDFDPAVNPADAARIAANPRLELFPTWFRSWVGVAWNTTNPLFADPEVRRALTMAIDRETIVRTLWGRYARVADSPIVAEVWAHGRSLRPWPYQPDEARRILAAKGWTPSAGGILARGGKPFAFELTTNTGNQQRVDALVMIQEQLRRIGVRAQPRPVEFNTLNSRLDSGAFEAVLMGQTMDTSLDLTAFFHSRSVGEANFTRYANPQVDRLIEASMSHPDISLARPELERIQDILHRDQPYSFLWESQRLHGISRRVHDARPTMTWSLFNLADWWVEGR